MVYQRRRNAARWSCLAGCIILAAACGCAMLPPNSLIDPTKVGRFSGEVQESGVRRVLTPRDTPPGLAHATEPTQEDLIPEFAEYHLMPGDAISVTINDLISGGMPYNAGLRVNPLGEIRLPELGSIPVAGLTEAEVEQELSARLREAGLLSDPVVMVFTQVSRGRSFTVLGAVGGAGTYQIPAPDMRLLDAIGMVGDVGANSRELYVIRRVEPEIPLPAEIPDVDLPAEDDEFIIPPPDEPDTPGMTFMTTAGYAQETPPPDTSTDEPPPTRAELDEVLAPPTGTRPADAEPDTRPAFEPLVFDPQTGRLLDVEPEAAESQTDEDVSAPPVDEELQLEEGELDEPFDWEDVDEYGFDQRVIAISVPDLKNGDPRQNIIVRNRDVINVPFDTGVFYMMGEVNRPGVYGFGGRQITIKQAVATAGGFSALAWPQRCEVIRREPGTDKQLTISVDLDKIFYGLEEDFYLRDNDIVNVGTHIVAPFLFVIRNSFRFTYGFGFVYDRNFADKDAYGARTNPQVLEQIRESQRGLPF